MLPALILNLLPFLFPFFSILGILAINKWRPSMGMAWVVALAGSLLSWITILVYRWVSVPALVIRGWLGTGGTSYDLIFGYDATAWHFLFCCASILMAIMLTAPVRITSSQRSTEWALDLMLGILAMFPILSQNPLSLILSWTLLDVIEIVFHLRLSGEELLNRQAIMAFAARLAGTFVMYWAFLSSQFTVGSGMDFSSIEAGNGLLFLLAAGLRLGVFPVLVPFSREIPLRREAGTLLRFVVPASSLALLTRLDGLVMPAGWAVILSILALAASVYGVIRYFFASSELTGRSFWVTALAGMATVSIVRGEGEAALIWSTVLLLFGTFQSLHSYRLPGQWWLMLPGFVGLSGLPFTPGSQGWEGLLVLPFNALDIGFLFVFIWLLLGYLKHAFRPDEPSDAVELWMKVLYPFGFLLLVGVQWFTGASFLTVTINTGTWWASVVAVVAALGVAYLVNRWVPAIFSPGPTASGVRRRERSADWGYMAMQTLYVVMQSVVDGISRILEGEGAILWALILMVLILTLLRMGGTP
ncbi:MAG: hypothetical protein HPY85_13730 [Anaerolineae bacterium]|nr:hypothetical protein [Anaerolineae bacterium]